MTTSPFIYGFSLWFLPKIISFHRRFTVNWMSIDRRKAYFDGESTVYRAYTDGERVVGHRL